MIRLKCSSRTSRRLRTLLTEFATWLDANYRVEHEITVRLFNKPQLSHTDKTFSAASFYHGDKPEIWLAVKWRNWANILSWEMARLYLLDSFAHEFCHYARWKSGEKNWGNHRGLQRRVNAMLKRFEGR